MGKIAFVFSGQGDQYPGMGKNLYDQYPAAAKVFNMCDDIRPGTSDMCFFGSDDELKETKNTQPCLFAMELAACAVLRGHGITPDAAAGFSLGEVSALTAAEMADLETSFRLVCRRGEIMQQASDTHDTSMAAVLKLPQSAVEELCSKYSNVYPVNFNCPGQITVAGLADEIPAFSADVKAAGGRALPLKVKGAFHSPFMNDAAESFAKELENIQFQKSAIPLYSNVTAQPYTGDVKLLLSRQICSPVMWETLIRNMIKGGIDTFIEIGPGKTLTNMIRKIDSTVKTYAVSELAVILSEVKPC